MQFIFAPLYVRIFLTHNWSMWKTILYKNGKGGWQTFKRLPYNICGEFDSGSRLLLIGIPPNMKEK